MTQVTTYHLHTGNRDHPPFIEGEDATIKPKCFVPLNSHWFYMEGQETLGYDVNGGVVVGVAPGSIRMVKHALCGWERPDDRKAYPINGEVHCKECLLRSVEIMTGAKLARPPVSTEP